MALATRRDAPWFALLILTAISTIGFIDRIIVNVLVEPVKTEFSLSDTQVSLMGTAFTVLNIGIGLIMARYAERKRRLTLISFGTVLWSVATAVCGMAGSWIQLLTARMGVGVGEAIGLPSLQSVMADYFPPSKRGVALSVLALAPPLGAFIGFVGGGWIAQNYDWRLTFIIAAIPGLLLGAVAWLFVAEPPRGQYDKQKSDIVPPFGQVVRRFLKLPSARHLVMGSALAAMIGFGVNYFFTSLMIRKFDLPLGIAGLYSGVIASLPAALSIFGTGWLGDRWAAKNPAGYALIPAICLLIGGPIYAFGITREDLSLLLPLIALATFLNFGYLGITYAALQNLMHPRMRATASAVLNVVYGIASAMGPLVLGIMSDSMASGFGPDQGLVVAMAIAGLFYTWAGVHYLLASRHLAKDMAWATEAD